MMILAARLLLGGMFAVAALAKLYYLFSRGYTPSRIRREMQKDLRGEMTVSR